ncbi:MAG: hypothetical protein AAF652_08030, partial [Cyanobacteria bacterium P01_C01_bin.72]
MRDTSDNEINPSSANLGIRKPLGCPSPLGQTFISRKFIRPLGARSIARKSNIFTSNNEYFVRQQSNFASIGDRPISQIDSLSNNPPAANNNNYSSVRPKPQTNPAPTTNNKLQRQTQQINTAFTPSTSVSQYQKPSSNNDPIQQQTSISETAKVMPDNPGGSNASSAHPTKPASSKTREQTIARKIDSNLENSSDRHIPQSAANKLTSFIQQKSELTETTDSNPSNNDTDINQAFANAQEQPVISRRESTEVTDTATELSTTEPEIAASNPVSNFAPIQREIDSDFLGSSDSINATNSPVPKSTRTSKSISAYNQIQREEISPPTPSANLTDSNVDSSQIEQVQRQSADLIDSSEITPTTSDSNKTSAQIQREANNIQVIASESANNSASDPTLKIQPKYSNSQSVQSDFVESKIQTKKLNSTDTVRSDSSNSTIQTKASSSTPIRLKADNTQDTAANDANDTNTFNANPKIQPKHSDSQVVQSDSSSTPVRLKADLIQETVTNDSSNKISDSNTEIQRETLSNPISVQADSTEDISPKLIGDSAFSFTPEIQTQKLDSTQKIDFERSESTIQRQATTSKQIESDAEDTNVVTSKSTDNLISNADAKIQTQTLDSPHTVQSDLQRTTVAAEPIAINNNNSQEIEPQQKNSSIFNAPAKIQAKNIDSKAKPDTAKLQAKKETNSQTVTSGNLDNAASDIIPKIQAKEIDIPEAIKSENLSKSDRNITDARSEQISLSPQTSQANNTPALDLSSDRISNSQLKRKSNGDQVIEETPTQNIYSTVTTSESNSQDNSSDRVQRNTVSPASSVTQDDNSSSGRTSQIQRQESALSNGQKTSLPVNSQISNSGEIASNNTPAVQTQNSDSQAITSNTSPIEIQREIIASNSVSLKVDNSTPNNTTEIQAQGIDDQLSQPDTVDFQVQTKAISSTPVEITTDNNQVIASQNQESSTSNTARTVQKKPDLDKPQIESQANIVQSHQPLRQNNSQIQRQSEKPTESTLSRVDSNPQSVSATPPNLQQTTASSLTAKHIAKAASDQDNSASQIQRETIPSKSTAPKAAISNMTATNLEITVQNTAPTIQTEQLNVREGSQLDTYNSLVQRKTNSSNSIQPKASKFQAIANTNNLSSNISQSQVQTKPSLSTSIKSKADNLDSATSQVTPKVQTQKLDTSKVVQADTPSKIKIPRENISSESATNTTNTQSEPASQANNTPALGLSGDRISNSQVQRETNSTGYKLRSSSQDNLSNQIKTDTVSSASSLISDRPSQIQQQAFASSQTFDSAAISSNNTDVIQAQSIDNQLIQSDESDSVRLKIDKPTDSIISQADTNKLVQTDTLSNLDSENSIVDQSVNQAIQRNAQSKSSTDT